MSPTSVTAVHQWLQNLANPEDYERIADCGCGKGSDILAFADRARANSLLCGFDQNSSALSLAAQFCSTKQNVRFARADLSRGIPAANHAFDLVYSCNLLECVVEQSAFLTEVHRVLRPGGKVVFAHWDWDTQLFDSGSSPKSVVREITAAYADWQQGWMTASDSWTGRRLWRLFNEAGGFSGQVFAKTLIETSFEESTFGQQRARDFGSMIQHGVISDVQYRKFIDVQEQLQKEGRYFYAITMFAYVGEIES